METSGHAAIVAAAAPRIRIRSYATAATHEKGVATNARNQRRTRRNHDQLTEHAPHSGMAKRQRGYAREGLFDRMSGYKEELELQVSRCKRRRASHLPEQVRERLADGQRFLALF